MNRKGMAIDLAKALGKQNAERLPTDPTPIATSNSQRTETQAPVQGRAPSRAGQTNISGWFDMPVKLKLDELRIARQRTLGRRITQQELLSEAFNDLFKKYGLAEMAPSGTDR